MVLNLRHFFLLIIIVNLIALVFFFTYRTKPPSKKNQIRNDPFLGKLDTKTIFGRRNATTAAKKNMTLNPKLIKPKKTKKIDPYMNYNIFSNLSLYTQLSRQYFNDDPNLKMSYTVENMGLINEDDYCKDLDKLHLNNISLVLNKMNFLTDYNADGLARALVMKKMGIDVFPDEISKDMNKTLWNSVISFNFNMYIHGFYVENL